MKSANPFHLVLITAPDLKTARKLARAALAARLIACANLLPRIESHYWWKGRCERAQEVLLLLKTRGSLTGKLERLIRSLHPYDTPEIITIGLTSGNARYLAWLVQCTGESQKQLRKSPDKKIRGAPRRAT
jgi:periplasmic divalent cation tolerance protein